MQLLIFNEEFLVNVSHQLALITSLPFVHTARRSYRLNGPVRFSDWGNAAGSPAAMPREVTQTLSFRGRRSRNKVSVGEPAEGSLPIDPLSTVSTHTVLSLWHRRKLEAVVLYTFHTLATRNATEAGTCRPYFTVHTTSNNGYLGSRNDEERSEMRYVMRIAEFSESSNL